MVDNTLTVEFSTDAVGDISTSISLDEEYNLSYYIDSIAAEEDQITDKSTFLPTETAFLKVIPTSNIATYSLDSSTGKLTVVQKSILFPIEEDIDFIRSKEETLSNIPEGSIKYEWIGNDGGIPLFVSALITVPEEIVGIMRVSYNTLGDRVKLTDAELDYDEYSVICLAIFNEDTISSTDVNFAVEDAGEDEDEISVSLEIVVKDLCTDEPVPFASVEIVGVETGQCNENGLYKLISPVITGQEYEIITSASGYQSSVEDSLNNDSFIVTKASTDTTSTEDEDTE